MRRMKPKKHTTKHIEEPMIEHFPVALTVWPALWPEPQDPRPWTQDAVLWLPDGEPRFGRRNIEARLAADPELLPQTTHGAIEFSLAGDHAFEVGQGRWHGRTLGYLRVWRRTLGWCVAREVWDAGLGQDEPFELLTANSERTGRPAMQHAA